MSLPRGSAAVAAVVVSGFVAIGCWYAGLVADLGSGSAVGRPVWSAAAVGAAVLGAAVWARLLPRARVWGVPAVVTSVAVWFLLLGGANTWGTDVP